ncbi:MAG: metallophosphoesterase [Pseudobacteriovorax sp.]|nr:metallophosphoesterase [Pseudobacteriovorax sp.]
MTRYLLFICFIASYSFGMTKTTMSETNPKRILINYINSDWSGEDTYIYYGFNGWNLKFIGSTPSEDSGNLAFAAKKVMRANSSGWDIELDVPDDARAIHYVFCRSTCRLGDWDNNLGKDYGYPFTFPYIGPILTLGDLTESTLARRISFSNATARDSNLHYRKVGDSEWTIIVQKSKLHPRFLLQDLKANSTYEYYVSSGKQRSERFRFHTKTIGPQKSKFRFVVLGDAQSSGEDTFVQPLLSSLKNNLDAIDLIVSPGDLAWNDLPGSWWTFFDNFRLILASVPFMPTVGNHDTPTNSSHPNSNSMTTYFPIQESGAPWYSFNFGTARFLGLNSELRQSFRKGGRQYRFASDWKKKTNNETWSFGYWHISPLNLGRRHWGTMYRYREMTELISPKVDWIFSGHEHLYQRFSPARFAPFRVDKKGSYADQDSTGVMIIPPIGAFPESRLVSKRRVDSDLFELLEYPKKISDGNKVSSFPGYVEVAVNDNQITLAVFGLVGNKVSVIESFSYQK